MNEDIKEVLEHLSATQKINNGWTSFSDKECKRLYDYIINLQNIINELENILSSEMYKDIAVAKSLDKLKELKEEGNKDE